MRKLTWLFLLFTCSFVYVSAVAGEYFLIEREKYPLCQELVENFNTFKDEPPMVCKRKFNPDFKNLKLPKWEEINASEYFNTIKRLATDEKFQSMDNNVIEQYKLKMEKGIIKLYRAKIDINFDGHVNTVYRMKERDCDPVKGFSYSRPGGYRYFAEQNFPDKKHQKGLGNFNGRVYGGIFLYKGRPYLHEWMQQPLFLSDRSRAVEGPSPRIAVYEPSQSYRFTESYAVTPVCEIGYRK